MEKERSSHYDSTACYLIENKKALMIQFSKKWGQVYAPPGGKFQYGETPTECMIREFKEETNLELLDLKLKGISYWDYQKEQEGIIYIFVATKYKGKLKEKSEEGNLHWIPIENLKEIKQFDMNCKFTEELFTEGIWEGKFLLKQDDTVQEFKIEKI